MFLLLVIFTTERKSNTQDDAYIAIFYGKAIAIVHLGHSNECGGYRRQLAANS